MISNNKITKYLIYAIGELFLVVLGILIALQINKWNDNRVSKKEAQKLYVNLKRDLQDDIEQLDFNIVQTQERNVRIDSIISILASPDDSKLPQFMRYQIGLIYDNYFSTSRSTFDEAVASGKINLIAVDSIRKKLFQYYALNSNNRNNDNSNFYVTNQLILPIITKEIFATQQGIQVMFQKSFDLPPIDLNELAKNQSYFQALIYAKSDGMQIEEWIMYKKMSQGLINSIDKLADRNE
ncbi:DUF6090 family protein [Aegicerativicinus sediminis]|uniref:DUF6090 family protein n=1 Tax=Aegicerativicinus sediminis TaxID=2893202 RepID=UPI001E3C54F4|nr:DUF6090 family protein [Aegicerativicinus sediminis]